MSRIGKKPIPVPGNVQVQVEERRVKVKGPHGELTLVCHPNISVEFDSGAGGASWVGNFQRGNTSLDAALAIPGSSRVLVIAGGEAYEVEPSSRSCVRMFGGSIEELLEHDGRLVLSNGIWLEAFGAEGFIWRSRRISWDGFRNLRVEEGEVLGEAWNPFEDECVPFAVDLSTGEVRGGSYPPEG